MVLGRRRRKGGTIIEFTLVGIPLIFVLISIFEIARGMWIYHTLAYAVTEATRFASVHGDNCTSEAGNACTKRIADVAGVLQYAGVGLLPDQLTVTFIANAGTANAVTVACPLLKDCLRNNTIWPPTGSNLPGMDIQISASYPFTSAIAMFWPGASTVSVFPTFNLPATSRERIQF